MVEYIIEGKIVVITGCSTDESDIDIPEFIEGLPVGKISADSFNEMENLKRITFPKTLRFIGSYAFAGCKNLSEVVFQEGLETIEDWAFISCNIEKIEFPSTLKELGDNAFMGSGVKAYAEHFKELLKQRRGYTVMPKNVAVFPIELFESMENIKAELIGEHALYQFRQAEEYEVGGVALSQLDLPFVFDGDEVLVALTSKKELKDFHMDLAPETKTSIGLYTEDDTDFVVLKLNVFAAEECVGQAVLKAPYLEEATFEITDIFMIEEDGSFRYYLRASANFSCYGNGNPSREFAFDLFEELDKKFQTQLHNGLITEDEYADIHRQIEDGALDTVESYLRQVTGSPVLIYGFELLDMLLSEERPDKEKLTDFIRHKLTYAYTHLSDYESLEELCFQLGDVFEFVKEYSGQSLAEIKQTHGIYLRNDKDEELSFENMELYREVFVCNEENYTLYADYLNYIYRVLQKMNQQFSMISFEE